MRTERQSKVSELKQRFKTAIFSLQCVHVLLVEKRLVLVSLSIFELFHLQIRSPKKLYICRSSAKQLMEQWKENIK